MKKLTRMLILFFMMCISGCNSVEMPDPHVSAKQPEITIEQAKKDLLDFMASFEQTTTRSSANNPNRITEVYVVNKRNTRNADERQPLVYVFNFANQQGFAIMSAVLKLPSMLAYTESGSYNPLETSDNPGLNLFMDNIHDYEVPGPEPPIDYPGESDWKLEYGQWETTTYKPEGWRTIEWGQGSSDITKYNYTYNKFCPIKKDKPTLTGCVATAVAQLMSIYRYPTQYGEYSFSWDIINASAKIDGNSSTNQIDGIARLMQQLGTKNNLDISYGNELSGADPDNIPRTLKNFGYSNGGELTTYSSTAIGNELKNGYPVLVGGYGSKTTYLGIIDTYSKGHLWLCDALLIRKRAIYLVNIKTGEKKVSNNEINQYFHYNWGWNGSSNGYFLTTVFDPSQATVYDSDNKNGSSCYRYNNKMVIGIRK